ncbi:MAG TPA: zinc ribbon domain-containing protein [Gemmatimonadaceae bacterium]|nr:zinc ribbon domain-containing protein [Gemmatimonadaceae bacterium]
MTTIQFTNNYTDLSSNRGYQFKFFCQKCGNGYLSTFKPNSIGTAAAAANAVSSFLGGIFGRAAAGAQQLEALVAGSQHDAALKAAVDEIGPSFKQCSRCGNWVCEQVCWNAKAGLCETCAPALEEEKASAQAYAARDQVNADVRAPSPPPPGATAAPCRNCGADTKQAKFCPECGTPTALAVRTCTKCGASVQGGAKFCPECGNGMS